MEHHRSLLSGDSAGSGQIAQFYVLPRRARFCSHFPIYLPNCFARYLLRAGLQVGLALLYVLNFYSRWCTASISSVNIFLKHFLITSLSCFLPFSPSRFFPSDFPPSSLSPALHPAFLPSLLPSFRRYRSFSPMQRIDWDSRVISTLHALVVFAACVHEIVLNHELSNNRIWCESCLVRFNCAIVVG